MGDEHLDTISAMESDEFIKSSVESLVPILSESEGVPENMCDVPFHDNSSPLDVSKDQFEDFSDSTNKSTSIDDDSFSINNIEYVEASPPNSELASSEVMEIVILKVGGIDDDILLTIKDNILHEKFDDDSLYNENIEYVEASPHNSELVSLEAAEIVISEEEEIEDDNLRKKLLNVHLLIANIEGLKDNPAPSFEFLTKSSSTSPKSFLEETNTFHNSLPESKNFYFDLGEISSGSTTTHFDISLSEYDSFIFDFTHEEFVDELAHIISPPEYDYFYFWNLPDPSELMSVLNSEIRENLSTTRVNLPIKDDHSPILAYVVWIFLAYLTYHDHSPLLAYVVWIFV
nr:hypothetical protein [Tanacetum cinerariifolium]